MNCQKYRNSAKENIGVWVNFFLDCIIDLSSKLESKLNRILSNDIYLNVRQKAIVDLISNSGKLRAADLHSAMQEFSLATIKKDLKYLVENQVIGKEGVGRATTYSMLGDLL